MQHPRTLSYGNHCTCALESNSTFHLYHVGAVMAAVELPQKKFYRQRAHSNPLADHTFSYPAHPGLVDWRRLFPAWEPGKSVRFLDVGCGYGGLLVKLSELYPDTLVLGVEIRVKVSDYVQDRLKALRQMHPGRYGNVAVLRTNAMKYLPNYFEKGQLNNMFFLFPDPHFKKTKHKWRIVNNSILAEYAYLMAEGGVVYTGMIQKFFFLCLLFCLFVCLFVCSDRCRGVAWLDGGSFHGPPSLPEGGGGR